MGQSVTVFFVDKVNAFQYRSQPKFGQAPCSSQCFQLPFFHKMNIFRPLVEHSWRYKFKVCLATAVCTLVHSHRCGGALDKMAALDPALPFAKHPGGHTVFEKIQIKVCNLHSFLDTRYGTFTVGAVSFLVAMADIFSL